LKILKKSIWKFSAPENINLYSDARYWGYCVLFLSAFVYSYLVPITHGFCLSILTVAFLLILFACFIYSYRLVSNLSDTHGRNPVFLALISLFLLHAGVLAGFLFSGNIESVLWVKDSYDMHVPGALNISRFISGDEPLRPLSGPFDKIYFTHVLVGVSFWLLGDNPISSGIVLLFARGLTVVVIYALARSMFGNKAGAIGALIYAFMPTLLFYTTSFYKEAIVQLLVALMIYSFNKILKSTARGWEYLLLFLSLILIANERFYLFPMFLAALVIISVLAFRKIPVFPRIGIIVLAIAGGLFFFSEYYLWLYSRFLDVPSFFSALRVAYTQYPDVAPHNAVFPYWMGFVKILLTPVFTLNKFAIFSNYAYLLIWGSFFNQIVMLFGLAGIFFNLRLQFKDTAILVFPFFLFVCLFAYVAPYNGRLRDSFYPVIAVYAGYAMRRLAEKWGEA